MKMIYLGVMAALLLISCKEHQTLPPDQQPSIVDVNKQEIKFNFFVEEGDNLIPYETYWNAVNPPLPGPLTRADITSSFSLYGVFNTVDVPNGLDGVIASSEDAPVSKRFFNDFTVNSDGTYSGERRYWVADGKTRHTFAAIAGKSANGNKLYEGFSKGIFIPIADHYVSSDPKLQTDLLLAYGPANVVVDGVAPEVNIKFKHALSKLRYKVISVGGVTLYNCVLKITYGSNVYGNTGYYYNSKIYRTWTGSNLTGTYSLATAATVPATAVDIDHAFDMGEMFSQPIDLKDSWLTLELIYSKVSGGSTTTLKSTLPAQQLKQGMQYTYYLYVSEVAEVLTIKEIVVEPWTTEIRMADPLN